MQKKTLLFFVLAVGLLGVLLALPAFAQDDMPGFADLEAGAWTTLEPGGDTICSNGTPFEFHVRPAETESNKLLIYLNGGGACWFGQICDLEATPSYTPFADSESNDPSLLPGGIFDLDNEENPFLDYNMVFIPYCTADVHIGNSVQTYPVGEDDEVTIHHNGYNNVMAVLDWTFANFEGPDNIFVSGSSAGSIPSPFYTGLVAEQYPDAQIAQLGDASGGYRAVDNIATVMEPWGVVSILPDWPEYEGETSATLPFEDFYIASGKRYPDITFAQYNAVEDETQYFFLTLLGVSGISLPDLIDANFADINAEIDNFRYYSAGGPVHTILRSPIFYDYEVNGVRFVDWVADLAAGEAVENVACEGDACAVAPGESMAD